jgi:hypothetical protein
MGGFRLYHGLFQQRKAEDYRHHHMYLLAYPPQHDTLVFAFPFWEIQTSLRRKHAGCGARFFS